MTPRDEHEATEVAVVMTHDAETGETTETVQTLRAGQGAALFGRREAEADDEERQ